MAVIIAAKCEGSNFSVHNGNSYIGDDQAIVNTEVGGSKVRGWKSAKVAASAMGTEGSSQTGSW